MSLLKKKHLKSLLFLFSILFFSSCSSDKDLLEEKSDKIVGEWAPLKEVFTFVNDSVSVKSFPQCEQGTISNIIFGDAKYDQFFALYFNINNGDVEDPLCVITIGDGNWAKVSERRYSVYVEYFDEYEYPPLVIGEANFLYDAQFPTNDTLYLQDINKLEDYQLEMENLESVYTVYTLDKPTIGTPYGN